MKYKNLMFAALLICVTFASCLKVQIDPAKKTNEMMHGDWKAISYKAGEVDLTSFVLEMTFAFFPSSSSDHEGTMITKQVGQDEKVEKYRISEDGKEIIISGEANDIDINSRTLVMSQSVADESGSTIYVELVLERI